jgi:hypothetical protein
MNKSDLLAGVSRAMMAEVAQDIPDGRQTQTSIHAEDVPPNIRNVAYEMAGNFFGQNERTAEFRGMAGKMTAETFAIVSWPQFVNMAIECLTECLTWPGFPQHEKDMIAEEIIAFNTKLDARARSVVRTKKILEPLN